jgi:hypothetical protein
MSEITKPILIAIPNDTRVAKILAELNRNAISMFTSDDSLLHAKSSPIAGAVVTSHWLVTAKGEKTDLHATLFPVFPTLTLIFPPFDQAYLELIYRPPRHEFLTLPYDQDDLIVRMKRTGMISK